MSKLLFNSKQDWDFETLYNTWEVIKEIGKELKVDYHKPQFEIISSEQMLDAYCSVGMPIMYKHWSYGKSFVKQNHDYQHGRMGLAYEIVINSNPCIAYLMETNSMTMQALVMAHASVGHAAVFKNNYLFKEWTDPDSIIDFLVFAKKYVKDCEEKYGVKEVEMTLDAAHSLQHYAIDKYKRKHRAYSQKHEQEKHDNRIKHQDETYDELWERTVRKSEDIHDQAEMKQGVLEEPEENILYFIEKNSRILKPWQREILRIIRKIAQYYHPQACTKNLNEGFATFTHHYIMTRLHEEGYIDDGSFLEFIASHSGVIYQPDGDSKYYSGINPYALGFNIFRDIKRMCENPTEEDYQWFPNLAGTDWVTAVNDAMRNYKDDSFVQQFLSPKVMRDMKLFTAHDDYKNEDFYTVSEIASEQYYRDLRFKLANTMTRDRHVPEIHIIRADMDNDRRLVIKHIPNSEVPLDEKDTIETMKYIKFLWSGDYDYPIELHTIENVGSHSHVKKLVI